MVSLRSDADHAELPHRRHIGLFAPRAGAGAVPVAALVALLVCQYYSTTRYSSSSHIRSMQ